MDKYGILSGYEERLEEDDEQRSRAIPSRTSFGSEAEFISKFPSFGGTKWRIRNFGYRCELTLPQIEIMMSDLPHTLYKDKNQVSQKDVDDAERKTREAWERKQRERAEKKEMNIDDVFNVKE